MNKFFEDLDRLFFVPSISLADLVQLVGSAAIGGAVLAALVRWMAKRNLGG